MDAAPDEISRDFFLVFILQVFGILIRIGYKEKDLVDYGSQIIKPMH
jgi:hypothetical protein